MLKWRVAVASILAMFVFPVSAQVGNSPSGVNGRESAQGAELSHQAWRQRRNDFFGAALALQKSQGADQRAATIVSGVVAKFERDPLAFTPLEAMDIIGFVYMPRDSKSDLLRLLAMVAKYATLGWYDALRFGDDSSRSEIGQNEGFFKRAFLVGNTDAAPRLAGLMGSEPAAVAAAVAKGIAEADSSRGKVTYNVRWPTVYGLGPLVCATSDGKDCPAPKEVSKDMWDAAFSMAAERVATYYKK